MVDQVRTISFSGYEWDVRASGSGPPDQNIWDDANAQVDDKGWLHLKLTKVTNAAGNTEWHCVELSTQQRLGFGRYQFQVIGRIDKLDRNVVLGLFKYPTPDVFKQGPNEIDIEFARWGDGSATATNADYVVLPASGNRDKNCDTIKFMFALKGDYTTHRFLWESSQVTFRSLHGHRDDDLDQFEFWRYSPNQARLIPQQPTPVHINLWLYLHAPPSDGAGVEIVISQFTFMPTSPVTP